MNTTLLIWTLVTVVVLFGYAYYLWLARRKKDARRVAASESGIEPAPPLTLPWRIVIACVGVVLIAGSIYYFARPH